jgi:hypothetical protein
MLGWTKISDSEDVACYRKPNSYSAFDSLKAETVIPRPPEAVAKFVFANWENMNLTLDADNLESFELVREVNDKMKLFYAVARPKSGTSGRDVTYVCVFLPIDETTFAIVGNSVDDMREEREGYVRADLKIAMHLF